MMTLPTPAALAPRAAANTPQTAGPDSGSDGDGGTFAAALNRASDPAGTASEASAAAIAAQRPDAASDAGAREDTRAGPPDGSEPGTAADIGGPDLSALLPGWPPATPAPVAPLAPTAAAPGLAPSAAQGETTAAVLPLDTRASAALHDSVARERGPTRHGDERSPSRDALAPQARPVRADPNTPAAPPVAAALAAETTAPPTASKPDAAAMAALAAPAPSAAGVLVGTTPGAVAAGAPLGASAAGHAASPFVAHLAAAIDSPAFAPALATQVTWLAGEGVQQARISLNPVETGPLTVRIVLDGTQARIDFSADLAATRTAIEASLPTLAAALHDQGLTLAGGGVHDGQARPGTPRERQAHGANPGPGQAVAVHAEAASGSAVAPRAARGLVDLVA